MSVTPLTSLPANLGFLVQIAFNKGVFNQIPDDIRDWEQIMTMRVNDPLARTSRYAIQTGMGPAATQMRDPGTTGRTFPRSQFNSTQEIEFTLKEWNTTIGLPLAIVNRAMTAKDKKYIEPIAYEAVSKSMSCKRIMTADWHADGTGVRGKVGNTTLVSQYGGTSTSDPATITVQLSNLDADRGYAGWFEFDDLYHTPLVSSGATRRALATTGAFSITDPAATTIPTAATASYHLLRVRDRDHFNNQVTFDIVSLTTSTNTLTGVFSTAPTDVISVTAVATTDNFFRYDMPSFPNLSIAVPDYGLISACSPGLESLGSHDGRTLDGIVRSGILAASNFDCGTASIDFPFFGYGLSKGKRRVGEGKYKYPKALMAAETHEILTISREADRRFNLYTDNKRGTTFWAYSHRKDIVEAYVSEFCRQNRVWILPENATPSQAAGQSAGKVFEYHGTDFMPVVYPGSPEWHLRPSSAGGYTQDIEQYLRGMGRFVCKQSAALVKLHNFVNT